jgi:general L-amino acid transport system permease protein
MTLLVLSRVPRVDVDWATWRKGLFGSPTNITITAGFAALLYFVIWPFLRWAILDATWRGNAEACSARSGACWAFVVEKARFIVFGLYPQDLQWQAAIATLLIIALVLATGFPFAWRRGLVSVWIVVIALAVAIMSGLATGHPVATDKWGGFPLTVLLAVVGFVGAFPLAVALALARRSRMGLMRVMAVAVIECVRGVPMIAVLYVSTLLFPLMLPAGASIDKLLRAQAAIVIFIAAYMAENVRAGLQAVPKGQLEAAQAVGLSWSKAMRLVVLPQALRAVIPSFVNLGIGLFLDTTLVIVIGLFDFLNTAKVAATDPNWLGYFDEAYLFAALVYFVICFGGSRYSLWLEARLARRPEAKAAKAN